MLPYFKYLACANSSVTGSESNTGIKPFGDRQLYRIADISTPEGRRLQLCHAVAHVTLLLFDGESALRCVLTGVKSGEALQRTFEIHLERWR